MGPDSCSKISTGHILFGKPATSLCPYICDNGVQSLRLNTETMRPASSRDSYFGNHKGIFQSKDTSYKHILETGGQVSNSAVAVTEINNTDGVGAGTDSYTQYCGDGSGYPSRSAWVSFENMYEVCLRRLAVAESLVHRIDWLTTTRTGSTTTSKSCSPLAPSTHRPMTMDLRLELSTTLSNRLLRKPKLTIVLSSPSSFRSRAAASAYPHPILAFAIPGLMQDHNGDATCNSDITGVVQNPCPQDVITRMVREGSAGTNDGDGLAQCINESGKDDATAFYIAARLYNSGSVDGSGDLCSGIATHCYSSDIANRLTGWVQAPHGCSLDG